MRLPISYTLIPEATNKLLIISKLIQNCIYYKTYKRRNHHEKLVGIGLAAAISLGALSGCSLLGEKANGFVLYGSEEQVQQITDKTKRSERKRLL